MSRRRAAKEPVAILGMAGRFPDAPDLGAFWRNLQAGVESIATFTAEELAASGVGPELAAHPDYVPRKGHLAGSLRFDAAFFGLSAREAELMDPQHRLLLETAWAAFEDAGLDPLLSGGRVGVFAGCAANTYLLNEGLPGVETAEPLASIPAILGGDKDYTASRISHQLDLRGPSLNVQAACATFLVAVHLAARFLAARECDLALAAADCVRFPERAGYLYTRGQICSPDGRCRAFDAAASGTVGGEGAGAVVLKRLADALAHGDPVAAVIRGSAVNNAGAARVGFTAPSVDGQAAVVAAALGAAGVSAASVGYVEAHGTATSLGDPVEVAALTRAFRASTSRRGFCWLGSVKSNIGHLDAAAGAAGLLKAVLALRHGEIPPSLHFQRPNPALDLGESPFRVAGEGVPWPPGGRPRRAGVNAFGMGGTNAHVLIEEAPPAAASGPSRPVQILRLSARTPGALAAAASRLADHLATHPELDLADVAYTLDAGRHAFGCRRAVLCRTRAEAIAALRGEAGQWLVEGRAAAPPAVGLLFPGQGSQAPGMACGLYRDEPSFRADLDLAAAVLAPRLGCDLRELLASQGERAAERLSETRLAQPLLFAVEAALARLLARWGLVPRALLGHSLGEYAAAAAAGVFSFAAGLELVAVRGELLQRLPRGAMLAVLLDEERARALAQPPLALAAVNGPAVSVLAGPAAAVARLAADLSARGIGCRRLATSHAFHTPMMEPALAPLAAAVGRWPLAAPSLPLLSNRTGDWMEPEAATDPGEWAQQVRQPVRFRDNARRLLAAGCRLVLEVGPGRALGGLVQQEGAAAGVAVAALPLLGGAGDLQTLLEAVARLWVEGLAVASAPFWAGESRRRLSLPTYPFEGEEYRLGRRPAPGAAAGRPPSDPAGPVRGSARRPLAEWFFLPGWTRAAPPGEANFGGGQWLLLVDEVGPGAAIAAALARRGEEVTQVHAGDGLARRAARAWTVDPRRRSDFAALLAALVREGNAPLRVVYLWGLGGGGDAGAAGETDRFLGLLHLGQAMAVAPQGSGPLRLEVVCDGLWEVTGGEALRPSSALLLGPARVLPLEEPRLSGRLIELAGGPELTAVGVEALLAELGSPPRERVVALRRQFRWRSALEPAPLPAVAAGGGARLRPDMTVLLTGGLGGMGLAFAEALARRGVQRLALLGRRLPPAGGGGARGQEVQDRLAALVARGAQVECIAGDVADFGDVERAVGRVESRWGRLDGVIHAAGVPGGQLARELDDAAALAVLAPKVAGIRNLARALDGRPLSFLLACSSIAVHQPDAGQVAYCAANAYLAAVCQERARRGQPWTAVDWDTWGETGMALAAAIPAPLAASWRSALARAIPTSRGQEALLRILAAGIPRVVVTPEDPDPRQRPPLLAAWEEQRVSRAASLGSRERGEAAAAHLRPAHAGAYEAPRNELEAALAELWARVLGFETVGIHDDFFELGGHSLQGIEIVAGLGAAFGLQINLADLLRSPTVARLAAVLEEMAAPAGRDSGDD